MKKILFLALLLGSVAGFTQTIKDKCVNAYYATGYVKLNQYKVTIDKDIDESLLPQIEKSLEVFEVLSLVLLNNSDYEVVGNLPSVLTIKDSGQYDLTYDLEALNNIEGVRVDCKYDI